MENMRNVAGYIAIRYKKDFGTEIDEMKLHKMMYFAQRESYVMHDEPLFEGVFYGWKFGPILKEIRKLYKEARKSIFKIYAIQPIVFCRGEHIGRPYKKLYFEKIDFRDKEGDLSFTGSVDEHFEVLMNEVFKRYASKDSWSLSRLTHGELSWRNSRIGVAENEPGDNPISESDIILDAKRTKARSSFFSSLTD